MWWNSRFAGRSILTLCLLASATAFTSFARAGAPLPAPGKPPLEMSFMKGDTRNGSRVHIRIVGDSMFYRETVYTLEAAPAETYKRMFLFGQRRRALMGVMGQLPRYPAFGTCFGKDMRFYMVETEAGKFYRSLPERSGKCYLNEPGIWSLFQDLDDLVAPPTEPEFQEYSAS